MIGETIAHYHVTEKIGAGGMGEIWRARDTKLNRDVALKILPEIFSADAERMSRFAREARVLASLNHPNIAAIYGVEESRGRRALVLELVEGEDLAPRLQAGPIPVDDALDIARQIAEALESAHEKGIVHRDLKPANVKLTPDGTVKVLDFGLAKAIEGETATPETSGRAASLSPTLTAAATRAGVVLGTAAYMSPEQAKGKRTDRRSDIFSFGVLLFEMLARRPCFGGESVSDTLAAVIKDEPGWSKIPSGVPAPIVRLLRRCLEKDPKLRLQAIGEARIALDAVLQGSPDPAVDVSPTTAGAGWRLTGAWLLAATLLVATGGLAGWWAGTSGGSRPPVRFFVQIPDLSTTYEEAPAISPDGRRIAYIASDSLWIRDLDSLEPREVEGSQGARSLCWSPDGASLAFAVGRTLRRADSSGRGSTVVSQLPFPATLDGAAWDERDMLYLAPASGGIHELPAQGGDAKPFLEREGPQDLDFHTPSALPGGRGLLYSVHRPEGIDTIEALAGGKRRIVLRMEGERLESAVYARSGHIIYHRRGANGGLWALPFSLSTLEPAGEPFLIDAEGDNPSVSRDGTLLYTVEGDADKTDLVRVGRDGEILEAAGPAMTDLAAPEISPDGRKVLAAATVEGSQDVWMLDLDRGTWSRVSFGDHAEYHGTWLPDGDRILIDEGVPGMFRTRVRSLGSGDEMGKPFAEGVFVSIDRTSRWAIYTTLRPETAFDVFYRPLDGDGEDVPFLDSPESDGGGVISPDGRYVAYTTVNGERAVVHTVAFPSGEGKQQVSAGDGSWPRWRGDGKEIFYVTESPAAMMAVSVEEGPPLRLGTPRRLFGDAERPELDWNMAAPARQYDVAADGKSFLMVRKLPAEQGAQPRLVVVQDWAASAGR